MDIKKQVRNIWIRNIFKSYIWLIIPIALLGGIGSCGAYIDAGTHLTDATVSVRGYYRNDGTYVRSYNRRPPGGAIHDKPYETKRTLMGFLFFVCLAGGSGAFFFYIEISKEEAYKLIREYEEAQERKRLEEKRKRTEKLLTVVNYDFSFLARVPSGLSIGGISQNCKFCSTYLIYKNYYISFKAIKHEHYICIHCLKKRKSLGRGQPSKKYAESLNYTIIFEQKFKKFSAQFLKKNGTSKIKYSDGDLKRIFIEEIKSNNQ